MRHPWRTLCVLAGAGLVTAGCSTSPKESDTTSTTAGSPSNQTTTTAPPSNSGSTSTTTTAAVPTAGAGCGTLVAAAGPSQGAAGTITGSITLSDAGTATCTLSGYPTMALLYPAGTTLPVTIVDGLSVDVSTPANAAPATVTITATSPAAFSYQYSDVPTGSETSCPSSSTVSVTPPGESHGTQPFPLVVAPCDNGTIRVSPIYSSG